MQDVLQKFAGTRVLITGATGFTGQLLARTLVEAGAEVRAVARASSNLEPLSDLDIEWFRGEVYDEEVLTRAAEGVNYIFHVAAAFREEKATDEDYRKVHLYSTQTLARLVTGRPEFKRMVHVSTVGVHGHIEVDRADENYRFAPGDGYQRTKLEGEQWLLEYGKTHDLPFAIVRPTPIYGPGDMRLLKFFKMADKGFTLMLGSGRGMYHLVHVRDLVNVLLLAAVRKEALGEVFIAAADDPISIIDMGKAIGKAIGKTPRVIRLPIWPFYAAADVTKAVCKPFGIPPPIYRRRVGFYAKDRQFDNGKIKKVLGYTPLYDNETGLAETAHWYQEQGLINS
ncbi:MAG: NAD-dependent epimerase/dehydratase family protein [Pseudomonadota bacterium]|nr:NAD-dependent epimerase/dehydratase family protein [Pseudomonadota bacterium]